MRLATAASIAVLALSSAAIAQVASSPVEQKIPDNATPQDMATANSESANVTTPQPGAPSTALTNTIDHPRRGGRPPK